jgi:hypothetical protein
MVDEKVALLAGLKDSRDYLKADQTAVNLAETTVYA